MGICLSQHDRQITSNSLHWRKAEDFIKKKNKITLSQATIWARQNLHPNFEGKWYFLNEGKLVYNRIDNTIPDVLKKDGYSSSYRWRRLKYESIQVHDNEEVITFFVELQFQYYPGSGRKGKIFFKMTFNVDLQTSLITKIISVVIPQETYLSETLIEINLSKAKQNQEKPEIPTYSAPSKQSIENQERKILSKKHKEDQYAYNAQLFNRQAAQKQAEYYRKAQQDRKRRQEQLRVNDYQRKEERYRRMREENEINRRRDQQQRQDERNRQYLRRQAGQAEENRRRQWNNNHTYKY